MHIAPVSRPIISGEKVDLLNALLGQSRVDLGDLRAEITESGLAKFPWLTERTLQLLRRFIRTDEVGVHCHHTGELADRLDAVIHGLGRQRLTADE